MSLKPPRPNKGSIEEHLETARRNLELYQDQRIDSAWRLTMLFYSILHQVSAVEVKTNSIQTKHDLRTKWLYNVGQKVGSCYDHLRSMSEIARYQPGPLPYTDAQIEPGGFIYRKYYQPLAQWVSEQLETDPVLVQTVESK
ncbi:MAG: hypothetical protein ACIAQ0_14400 [Phycisphaerales bacterium JB058]